MNRLYVSICAFCVALAAFGVPYVAEDSVSVTSHANGSAVKISYTLTGEPAVVTVDLQTQQGGAWKSLGGVGIGELGGEANKLVKTVGTPVNAYWFPRKTQEGAAYAPGALRAVVQAWPTNFPPDYMVVNIASPTNIVRFYASTNMLPGGFTNRDYRITKLLMRKIPAAGVVWTMGTPTGEAFRTSDGLNGEMEAQHKVMLTDDYYAGVFEVTQGQYYNMAGNYGSCSFQDYHDSDILPYQQVTMAGLRGQVRADFTTYWPANGHNVTAGSTIGKFRAKCGIADMDLPTEAQWEYAARAGVSKNLPNGYMAEGDNFINSSYRYDRINKVAWWYHNVKDTYLKKDGTTETKAYPHPVGLKVPNHWGLYDTIGNVFEACLDHGWDGSADQVTWFRETLTPGWETGAVTTNPTGIVRANDSAGRVAFRGGSFAEEENQLRLGSRCPQGADYKDPNQRGYKGFRLVCSVKEAVR